MASAAGFQLVMVPSRVLLTIASSADETILANSRLAVSGLFVESESTLSS
jgi:hypothetical protein